MNIIDLFMQFKDNKRMVKTMRVSPDLWQRMIKFCHANRFSHAVALDMAIYYFLENVNKSQNTDKKAVDNSSPAKIQPVYSPEDDDQMIF